MKQRKINTPELAELLVVTSEAILFLALTPYYFTKEIIKEKLRAKYLFKDGHFLTVFEKLIAAGIITQDTQGWIILSDRERLIQIKDPKNEGEREKFLAIK